jgi:adenylate kinase family enzyme
MWKPVQEKKKKYAEIIVDGVCDHCGHRALTARVDDGEESIKKRIRIYHEVTESLENYYYAVKGLLRVVDADQPAAVVD